MFLNRMPIYAMDSMVDTHMEVKRKHKRKRIQKKWIKRYGYKTVFTPKNQIYIIENKIYCHPITFGKLEKAINNEQT